MPKSNKLTNDSEIKILDNNILSGGVKKKDKNLDSENENETETETETSEVDSSDESNNDEQISSDEDRDIDDKEEEIEEEIEEEKSNVSDNLDDSDESDNESDTNDKNNDDSDDESKNEDNLKDKCYQKFSKKEITETDIDYDEYFIKENEVVINKTGRLTKPYLTKYERVRILGDRARQLSQGAKPMLKNTTGLSHKEIALLELKNKIIPLIIERPIPNVGVEKWKLSELEII
jgi:DNA-directed RNA polymerase I, II, and III subunit RPABC2